MLEHRGTPQLHGGAQRLLLGRSDPLWEELPDGAPKDILYWPAYGLTKGLVGEDAAVLPVQRRDLLTGIVEEHALALVPVGVAGHSGRDSSPPVRPFRRLPQHAALDGAQLEATVAAQLEPVHQLPDQVEATSARAERVRPTLAIEAVDVEPLAMVTDTHMQVGTCRPELDLQVALCLAVAHGVGHRLLDGEDDVVDGHSLDALLVEVVADPLAGPQETYGLQRQPEGQAGLRVPIDLSQRDAPVAESTF